MFSVVFPDANQQLIIFNHSSIAFLLSRVERQSRNEWWHMLKVT